MPKRQDIEERIEIEKNIKTLIDAGVDVRIEGRGTFIIGAKNLTNIPKFKERADAVRKLAKGNKAT